MLSDAKGPTLYPTVPGTKSVAAVPFLGAIPRHLLRHGCSAQPQSFTGEGCRHLLKVSVIFRRGEKVMAIEIGGCIFQSGKRRRTDFLLKTPKSHGKKLGAKTESLNISQIPKGLTNLQGRLQGQKKSWAGGTDICTSCSQIIAPASARGVPATPAA